MHKLKRQPLILVALMAVLVIVNLAIPAEAPTTQEPPVVKVVDVVSSDYVANMESVSEEAAPVLADIHLQTTSQPLVQDLRGMQIGSLSIQTASGDVTVTLPEQAELEATDIQSGSGDLILNVTDNSRLAIARLNAGSGDVIINVADNSALVIRSLTIGSGDVIVNVSDNSRLAVRYMKTGSGDIFINAQDNCEVVLVRMQTGSGSVALTGGNQTQMSGTIETGSGDVDLTVPATTGTRILFEGRSGSVLGAGMGIPAPGGVVYTSHRYNSRATQASFTIQTGSGDVTVISEPR